MTQTRSSVQKRNDRMFAMFDESWELKARAAGWSPTGPHGKWVLAGDRYFSEGAYMPTTRACRYICEDHGLT